MIYNFNRFFFIPILLYLLFAPSAFAIRSQQCIPPTDSNTLGTMEGYYVLSSIIPNAERSGLFTYSVTPNIPVHIIAISKKGEVVFGVNWHEGWSWEEIKERSDKDCLKIIDKDTIVFRSQDDLFYTYTLLKGKNGDLVDDHKFFFNLLFNGCFFDSEKKKICFDNEKVYFDDKWHKAILHMDDSELPAPSKGNVLEVEGEKLFWLLKPIKKNWKNGKIKYTWELKETYWVTNPEYEKIDPNKLNKILTSE